MSSTMQERMGAFDAVMWNVEEDPVLRSVIVAMMVLDKAPTSTRRKTASNA